MCKRKRGDKLFNDDIKRQLHLAINDQMSAKMAVLYLMDEFDFDLEELKASLMGTNVSVVLEWMLNHILSEKGLNVSFSDVKYLDIAPFVGLDPLRNFGDAPLFDLRRSRIPTALFRDIVTDMDVLLIQYGTLQNHTTEEVEITFPRSCEYPCYITARITEFKKISIRSSIACWLSLAVLSGTRQNHS